jgi:plasmid replication initiation protein
MSKADLARAENYNVGNLDRPAGERWVTMNNQLNRAGHGLTLSEKRLVMMAISKLDSRKALRVGDIPTTRLTAAEYADQYEVDSDTAYTQLKSAAKSLYNRSITFFEPAHKRSGKPLKPIRTDMRWVGRCTYHSGEAWVELAWWQELIPFLTGLQKNFTTYQLQQASALRSGYSWRLLELLTRFGDKQGTGWAEYTIEDFCTSMGATEKQRANFNNIKRRIVEPAIKELTEKDGWVIEWEAIKAGRKVVRLRFDFKRNKQLQFDL